MPNLYNIVLHKASKLLFTPSSRTLGILSFVQTGVRLVRACLNSFIFVPDARSKMGAAPI